MVGEAAKNGVSYKVFCFRKSGNCTGVSQQRKSIISEPVSLLHTPVARWRYRP
jgi:hypothetical protein